MILYLYQNACSPSDYQDAALLCMLWYLFGRASDLTLVRKQNLSVDAAEVFFVRFIRLKTSEEQGLSLFPDSDFVTCPLHAIAVAVATQVAPSVAMIDNLPELPVEAAVTLSPAMPLLEVLNHPADFTALEESAAQASAAPASAAAVPTIYTHVNRLLDRVAHPAGVMGALTSHSFRRGGAQHVNGCDGLTQRWIFDRGAWNMSTTNKGFNYIFNTSREDHKVSKALSGYDTQTEVKALDLKPFDAETRSKITGFQRLLFTACYKMENAAYNLSQHVLDVLTAYLILHYPQMKKLQDGGLVVVRMEASAAGAGASVAELLAWPSHLASCQSIDIRKNKEQASTIIADRSNQNKIIEKKKPSTQ
ncbi:hypothetical protein AM587_10000804 [Phytophthora nicotianae]|uniref:Uncharacterized protein n=1 Tax=Phytophthora nicotianae TaxID=4792 RepID=A0A0W8CM38_PHYNI|nr:hypothetical protein AM587_10000804 [Phytophthora nicotianae]